MAIIHPDEKIIRVFVNNQNSITIQEITEDGIGATIGVEVADIDRLCKALRAAKQEIQCPAA